MMNVIGAKVKFDSESAIYCVYMCVQAASSFVP